MSFRVYEEGLAGSVCKECANWIFYDWYLCNEFANCDEKGFILLPVTECKDFKLNNIV